MLLNSTLQAGAAIDSLKDRPEDRHVGTHLHLRHGPKQPHRLLGPAFGRHQQLLHFEQAYRVRHESTACAQPKVVALVTPAWADRQAMRDSQLRNYGGSAI